MESPSMPSPEGRYAASFGPNFGLLCNHNAIFFVADS